jgi:thioredoxin-related protein
MSKRFRIVLILGLLFPFFAAAQADTLTPPYLKHPTLPPFDLLMADSVSHFTKANLPAKSKVLLMIFSPDCSHCQHTAEELSRYKEDMKDITVVMATIHPITDMRKFIEKYKLDSLENVKPGKDVYYLLPSFYSVRNLPFMAFYNKKGKLISVFEGSMSIPKVIRLFKDSR